MKQAGSLRWKKSADGRNFTTAALVFATSATGEETYTYHDAEPKGRTWYRIKLTDKNNRVSYTNTLAIDNTVALTRTLSLHQNPVESYLVFQFQSNENTVASINIYNIAHAAGKH